jgi:protein gp37
MKVAAGLERRFGSEKYRGLTKRVNGNDVWTGEVRLDEGALFQPLKWKRGRRIFVNSMSDLFLENLSNANIDRVFAVMALCPQHTFQVLTKRAERMRAYFSAPDLFARLATAVRALADWNDPRQKSEAFLFCGCLEFGHGDRWPLPNVWLGVSAERQEEADERIPHLMNTPASVRFISAEPLLGPLTVSYLEWAGLDWVICGGESGAHARPMHPEWARTLRDQCAKLGIPFFFKQWGEYANETVPSTEVDMRDLAPNQAVAFGDGKTNHVRYTRIGKKAAGRSLDGREHSEFPKVESNREAP